MYGEWDTISLNGDLQGLSSSFQKLSGTFCILEKTDYKYLGWDKKKKTKFMRMR